MRFLTTFAVFLLAVSSAAEGKTICTPTIGVGNLNYATVGVGLNRISEIEIETGTRGQGGYGIVLTLKGTEGKGVTKAKDVVHKLPWASTYGSTLYEYNNSAVAKNTLADPYIRFEMEYVSDGPKFLGALTFSSLEDPESARLLTSRYNCEYTP